MLALQAVLLLLEYCLSDLELDKPEGCKQLLGLPLCLLADETLHTFRAASQPGLYICTADQASLLARTRHMILHHQAGLLSGRDHLSIMIWGRRAVCSLPCMPILLSMLACMVSGYWGNQGGLITVRRCGYHVQCMVLRHLEPPQTGMILLKRGE